MSTMDKISSEWPIWEVLFPGTTPPWEDTPSGPDGSVPIAPDGASGDGADGAPAESSQAHPIAAASGADVAVIEAAVRRLLADEHMLDVIGQAVAHRVGLMPTARQIAIEVIAELRDRAPPAVG